VVTDGGKVRSSYIGPRPTRTLPLPGDADAVLAWELARAIHRDTRLNYRERAAKDTAAVCRYCKANYRGWYCSYAEPCYYCRELGYL
jgi:hypothetical protein